MTALYGDRLGAGAFVDGYLVEAHVGEGASADVYRAQGPGGRRAALKVLKRELVFDATALARFQDEARCLAAFTHPHLVRLERAGDLPDGRPYLALEWLEGETCAQRLAREGAQPSERVVPVLRGVASALSALHGKGFVHRDVSSHNVMCCADGRVVLLDFGVARSAARSSHLTSTGHLLGTPQALAPEVLAGGPASPASDFYGLGLVAWALLHGAPPFQAEDLFELTQLHLRGELPPWRAADAALEPAVRRCLSVSPDARPGSEAALLALLDAGGSERRVVAVYLCARGDADGLDAWEGALRDEARGWGLVPVVEGAALLLVLRVSDEADGARWLVRLRAWLAERLAAAPAGLEVDARAHLTTEGEALHPERW